MIFLQHMFGIQYEFGDNGEVEILGEVPENYFDQLQEILGKYSIEILHDQKSQLVQRVNT